VSAFKTRGDSSQEKATAGAAAQLVEAACRARDGDREAAKAHIARAVALLDAHPSSLATAERTCHSGERRIQRGGFAAWQAHRIEAYVDAKLAAKIEIRHLATLLDISVGHFCHAFKCTFGVPARTWITRRRIEVAQALMLTTSAPLSEIALRCGMSDQSHFTRAFRRVVGDTPYSWRQTRRRALIASDR
jgi:AraC family transcriptional regulator